MNKAILISDHANWCALMMNGIKKIEVRKGAALYKATKKLIDEYGYAEFYVYCTKGKPNLWLPYEYDCFELDEASQPYLSDKPIVFIDHKLNGKVIFKFRCYKVEEIKREYTYNEYAGVVSREWLETNTCNQEELSKKTCLTMVGLFNYLGNKTGYAIHISDLEIFDKPKELSEFYKGFKRKYYKNHFAQDIHKEKNALVQPIKCGYEYTYPLTKAPQNFCYVEVER